MNPLLLKIRKKGLFPQLAEKTDRARVMVWEQTKIHKIMFYTWLKVNKIPQGSYEVKEKGKPLRILGLDANGWYPITEDGHSLASPSKLYRAVFGSRRPLKELLALPMPLKNKIQLGILIVMIIAILIVTFLMSSQLMGGTVQ